MLRGNKRRWLGIAITTVVIVIVIIMMIVVSVDNILHCLRSECVL